MKLEVAVLVSLALGGLTSITVKGVETPSHLAAIQWGSSSPLPAQLGGVRAVALTSNNALTVDAQGWVQLWNTPSSLPPQLAVPNTLSNVVDVALGDSFAAALKSDGTVTCWGDITNSPASAGMSNIIQIAAGSAHLLALTDDGAVVAWGNNEHGQASVPPGLSNVVAIAANFWHSLALQADGRVIGWGETSLGHFDFLQSETNTAAIATGSRHMTLLRRNGTVAAFSFQIGPSSSSVTNVPPGLTDVLAVAAGNSFSLALDSNGAVVSFGLKSPPPGNVHDVAAIHAANGVGLAWVKYPVIGGAPTNIFAAPGATVEFAFPVYGEPPLHFQWLSNGIPITEATLPALVLTNIDARHEGLYSLTVSNVSGVATSPEIVLQIGPPTIMSHPEGTVATVGETVTLTVGAVGLEPLNYFWLRNGVPLPGALGNSLVLPGVQYLHTGDYQAVVTNLYGSVTSSVAHVEISILDQQQGTFGGWAHLQRDWDRCLLAQTFTPAVSGRLVQLSLSGSFGGVEAEIPTLISIFDTDNGRPGTNLLGRAVIPYLADSDVIRFETSAVYLAAGTEYAFVLQTEAPAYDHQSYRFRGGLYNPYPSGRTWQKVGDGPWLDLAYPSSTSDLIFLTYMVPGIPTVRLTSPAEGVIVRLGESTLITSVASELEPLPFSLSIYANGELLGASTNSPFHANWNPTTPGESQLFAILTNGAGLSFTSEVVHVTVVASGPDNDRFVDRFVLTNDYHVVAASNSGGTLDPGEAPIPSGLGASVWWQWTAPRSGQVVIAIEAPNDTNAVLSVYSGAAVDSLFIVTNGAGRCTFTATAGTTYQIALDSSAGFLMNGNLLVVLNDVQISNPASDSDFYAPALLTIEAVRSSNHRQLTQVNLIANAVDRGAVPLDTLSGSYSFPDSGYFSLRVAATDDRGVVTHSEAVPVTVHPSNDNLDAAEVISGRDIAIHTSNLAATKQAIDPKFADNQGGHSIWYLWTAPTDGLCTIDGSGTNFALLLNVCVGSTVIVTNNGDPTPGPLSVVAANAMGVPYGKVQFDAIAGATYYLSVDGFFGEEGTLDFSLQLTPYNDDFSDRRVLSGLKSGFLEFNGGASLEPSETQMAPPGTGSSLWYSWQAPLPGLVALQVTGTNDLAVAVYTGGSLAQLTLVTQSLNGWTTSPTVTFQAQSGETYQIAVFAPPGSTDEFTFNLSWQGLHFTSPLPNTVWAVPTTLALSVELGVPGKTLKQLIFKANGHVIGTVTNAPFALHWAVDQPGTYTLSAEGIATDNSAYVSVPVTCLVYTGDQMPRPRVYAGVQSDTSYVINAVGALHLFGGHAVQFGRAATNLASTPFLAEFPEGETGWKEISGGWGIANSGRLYQNGQTLIPFPAGVTAWQHVSRGFDGVVTIGDDGHLYLGGTTRIEIPQPPGGWKDARASITGVNDRILGLGEDHEAYLISSGPYGDWSVAMLTRPGGVNAWKSIAQAALFGVLLTDDNELWIYGMYGGVTGTSGTPGFSYVPRPTGVNRWVDFATGGYHVLAIGDNGQLYGWGRNWEHQLGIGLDQNTRATPVKVGLPDGVSGWSAVAAGQFHSLAIGLDCSLYAWGDNGGGQAGQPVSPPLTRPFRVGSLEALCGTPVLFADGNASRLPDGSFRLQFNTDLNRSYLIQYSDDMTNWKNASPAVTGTGELMEWLDNGPPKTDTHPAAVTFRIYRVVYAP